MASLLAQARRLTFWLAGTPDDSPPPVPIPAEITPLWDHVAFFLNLRGRLPPEMTRSEIMDHVNNAVTDRQLQAHVMAYLRDYHGVTFDPKLNPNAPAPRYYSSESRYTTTGATFTTGTAAEEQGATEFQKPLFPEPQIAEFPLAAGTTPAAPVSPKGGKRRAKKRAGAQTVTGDKEDAAPAEEAAPTAAGKEQTTAAEETSEQKE